jgi:hypothetical protein
MKIYSDHITESDVIPAFVKARDNGADIYVEGGIKTWRPRNHANGIEVFAMSLDGKLASGHSPIGSYSRDEVPRAASWDDWGLVIAFLFNIDPHARVGFYDNEADFVEKVRKYPRKGSTLAFLDHLDNIKEYD